MWLAFVTNGNVGQLYGITLLIDDLQHLIGPREGVFILSPKRVQGAVSGTLESLVRHVVSIVTPERSSDRYYSQIGLSEVFSAIEEDDQVLCLDYDHLVLGSGMAPACWPADHVWVSSEVHHRFDAEILSCADERTLHLLPSRHLGASLIFGCGRTLRPIGRLWEASYGDIVDVVRDRHRVEIALAMACERSGASVRACPRVVQGNFAVGCGPCWLFHYGGESGQATRVKALLAERSSHLQNSSADVRDIRRMKRELVRACFAAPI